MESPGDEQLFKYIPFRCYHGDDSFVQRLVRPITDEGQRKTIAHLLKEVFPTLENGTSFLTSDPYYYFY